MPHSHLDCGISQARVISTVAFLGYYQGELFFLRHTKCTSIKKTLAPTPLRRVKLTTLGDRVSRPTTATSYWHMTLARADNAPCRKTGEFSVDVSEIRPVNVITSIICHLKRPLRYGGYLSNQIQQNNFEMCKVFLRAMLSNVLTAK